MIRTLAVRRVVSLLLVLSFLGLGIAGFIFLALLREPPQSRVTPEHRLNVEVFQVGDENIRLTLRGFGTVQADREVVLSAEVAGTIDHVHQDFEVGHAVVAQSYPTVGAPDTTADEPLVEGDALAVIDQQRYLKQLEQVSAQIAELGEEEPLLKEELVNTETVQTLATGELELMLREFARQKDLYDKRVISKAELDRVELEVQQYQKTKAAADRDVILGKQRLTRTRLQIETLKVQKRLAQDDYNRTVIRPPFDGYISEVFVEVGQYVRPGEQVVRITNVDRVEIPVSLTLDDYSKLKPHFERGELPTAELSLHEDEAPAWTGNIVRLAPEANRETRTITVFVEVENAHQDVPLLPGTFVFARIEGPVYDSKHNIVIPRDAILGNRVFLVEDGIAREIPVQVIERLQSVAVVKGDLNPGDQVVITNLDLLTTGLPIQTGDHVRRLADELNPDKPWKSYWQIVPATKSTANTPIEPAASSAQSESDEVRE